MAGMKFREQVTQPGFLIDLMSAISIFSVPILGVIFFIEVLPHLLYHHGPNWNHLMISVVSQAACYLVFRGAAYLWRQHKSRRTISN
jgi:hypothetical protein